MLPRIGIALAAAAVLTAASNPTDALAFGRGGGGGHGGGFGGGGFGHSGFGGGGFARGFTGGGFARGGVARSFAAPGIAGRNFAPGGRVFADRSFARGDFRHRFGDRGFGRRFSGGSALGLGLGLGYGYYNDACYAWTPYGYRWTCDYDY